MSQTIVRKYNLLLNNRGGLRAVLKTYGVMRLLDTAMREAWIGCGIRILRMLGRRPGNSYGWLEAVLFPACDYWLRYSRVLCALADVEYEGTLGLLEVSSGRGGLAWLSRDPRLRICLVDRNEESLSDGRGGDSWRVCADAVRLPFPSNSFDVVLSVDTVEHLPAEHRESFVNELKRIAERAIVITCPLQSESGEFRAGDCDRRLRKEIESAKGHVPEWLEEHLREGHPTLEHLLQWLPDARITGTQNCDAWLRYASLYVRPFGWLIAGLRYRAILGERDAVPPYWRGTLVWDKRSLCLQSHADESAISESEPNPDLLAAELSPSPIMSSQNY